MAIGSLTGWNFPPHLNEKKNECVVIRPSKAMNRTLNYYVEKALNEAAAKTLNRVREISEKTVANTWLKRKPSDPDA